MGKRLKQSRRGFWGLISSAFIALIVGAPGAASANDLTLLGGIDAWAIDTRPYKDSLGQILTNNQDLLLPDAFTVWNYRSVSPFIAASGSYSLAAPLRFMFQARADQATGARLDEASLQYKVSPSLGARIGVVDYKTSWCRNYERDNGWIRDVEALCATDLFRDLTGGAPGVQLFTDNTLQTRYVLQTQVGVYNPLIARYAPDDFSGLVPSQNFKVTKNWKIGASVNLIDLISGIEARLSFMHIDQAGYQPIEDTYGYLAQSGLTPLSNIDYRGMQTQRGNLLYWGVSAPLTSQWRLRVTQFLSRDHSSCNSAFDDIFFRCNLKNEFDKILTSVELAYQLDSKNLISLGLSQTRFNLNAKYFLSNGDLAYAPSTRVNNSEQAMIAWRKDWERGFFTIIQGIWSRQNFAYPIAGNQQVTGKSDGFAVGLRVGFVY